MLRLLEQAVSGLLESVIRNREDIGMTQAKLLYVLLPKLASEVYENPEKASEICRGPLSGLSVSLTDGKGEDLIFPGTLVNVSRTRVERGLVTSMGWMADGRSEQWAAVIIPHMSWIFGDQARGYKMAVQILEPEFDPETADGVKRVRVGDFEWLMLPPPQLPLGMA